MTLVFWWEESVLVSGLYVGGLRANINVEASVILLPCEFDVACEFDVFTEDVYFLGPNLIQGSYVSEPVNPEG